MATVKVRYQGLSDERLMTQEQLAGVGITLSGDLHWERHGLPLSRPVYIDDPSEELIALFDAEGTFLVEAVDSGGVPDGVTLVKPDPGKADDTGAIRRTGSA
jgi:hypothetical protein